MGILTQDMKRVVDEQRLGFVATVCPDGTPNLSPKGTTAVLDDDHLVFADLRSPQTIRNLEANPAVEINVVDVVARKGYRFKGVGIVHREGKEFEEITAMFHSNREVDPSRIRAVVIVEVRNAQPLISPAYDTGMTEDEVRTAYKQRLVELYGPF
jgi:predicted pyridoxine 5'-phosphate oxidase superfamily flavin-nucleotide-binding protein